MNTISTASSGPTALELQDVRSALALRFPQGQKVLGAQLGPIIRAQLKDSNLRKRFGGLKRLVSIYFPNEIVWLGRQGLDDLYNVCFDGPVGQLATGAWKRVPNEPSIWFWSAVTNPSSLAQFGWSARDSALMYSANDVDLDDGLTTVPKLSKEDYQQIAVNFVATLNGRETSPFLEALTSPTSSVKFTTLMREANLLSHWEEFRVDKAVELFEKRLMDSGADAEEASLWASVLRSSQQQARSQRMRRSLPPALPISLAARPANIGAELPDSRAIAIKALEKLSQAEIDQLRLPLGTVMDALRQILLNA